MGLYRRPNSPYWWMVLTARGRRPVQQSTKIPHDAPSAVQRTELKRAAAAVYARAQAEHILAMATAAKPARRVRDHLRWYATHQTAHKRGAAREREMLATLEVAFGALQLHELTRERVIEWRTARATATSPATAERELDVLKHALTLAVPTYLTANPIARLRRLRGRARAPAVLSRADEAQLLAVLRPADRAIVIAALDTLLRASDLLRLERAHDRGRYLDVAHPKTGESYRVPVSARLRQALDALPKRGRYLFGHRRAGESPRTWTNSLKQMLEDGCRKAGVRYGRRKGGITFHGLRHTGATRLMEAGVDIRTIQSIGGWASIRMLTRYVHPADATRRAAVEAIGAGVPWTAPVHTPGMRRKSRKSAA